MIVCEGNRSCPHHDSGNMNHRIRSVISSLTVIVYATVSVLTVHAETICVGSDGHIAFEGSAGGDDCHGVTDEDPTCHSMIAPSGLNETCCTDFALPGRTVLKAKDSQTFQANPAVLVAWFLAKEILLDKLVLSNSAPVFDERAASARTRTSHQTVVLLI